MNKFVYLAVAAELMQAIAADPLPPYSQAWGNHLAAVLHQASDEAEACVFATTLPQTLPADFTGITKVTLHFAADGSPDRVAVAQSSGNAALDQLEVDCYRKAPHLKDVGLAMLPQHEVAVVSDWQALRKRH